MGVQRIVLGMDGTEGAARAGLWATELAAAVGARVLVVHVIARTWMIELSALQLDTDDVVKRARAALYGPWTQPLRDASVEYDAELVNGDPAADLLRLADDRKADLIVIGGTHHTGLRGAILGGTAHRIVNHALIPVVVVPLEPRHTPRTNVPIPG
jgi:nucleotide-binding universal stress UspA family protein